MKKVIWVMVTLMVLWSMVGCEKNQDNALKTIEPLMDTTDEVSQVIDKIEEEINAVEEIDAVVEELEEEITGFYAPLTGLPVEASTLDQRPIAVMLDNHVSARFQSGLSDADVVYEVLAEGSITRYMAVFQSRLPDVIGPVRSARPYYIQLALSYNPLYVHVGGSDQAFIDIKRLKMADIDGMKAGSDVYYRTDHKFIPHNMYTSYQGITIEQNRRNYSEKVTYEGLSIKSDYQAIEGDKAEYLKVTYKSPTDKDKLGYFIEFKYDTKTKAYKRYVNGQPQKDETTDIHLEADNILVLKADHKILDSAGRREVDVVGQGLGYYLNQGVSMKITWVKSEGTSATTYFDEDKNEIFLNPGITWVQIIPTSSDPIMN